MFKHSWEEALSFNWFLRGWAKAKENNSNDTMKLNEDNFNFAAALYGLSFFMFVLAIFVIAKAGVENGFTGLLGFPAFFYALSSGFWVFSHIHLDRQKKIPNWR